MEDNIQDKMYETYYKKAEEIGYFSNNYAYVLGKDSYKDLQLDMGAKSNICVNKNYVIYFDGWPVIKDLSSAKNSIEFKEYDLGGCNGR